MQRVEDMQTAGGFYAAWLQCAEVVKKPGIGGGEKHGAAQCRHWIKSQPG